MNDIIEKKAKCWNSRLQECLKDKELTQIAFADKLNERYGTHFTQVTVSDWLNIGNQRGKRKIGFPKYENMALIADYLEVDLGYLTGETDAETFTLEKVCDYTNLEPQAIKAITQITGTGTSRPNQSYFSQKRKQILNSLLTANGFLELVYALLDLDETYAQKDHEKDIWQHLENELGKKLLDTAIKFRDITAEDDEAGTLTDEEWEAIKAFNAVESECYGFSQSFKREIVYNRFAIQETMTLLINELYPISDK